MEKSSKLISWYLPFIIVITLIALVIFAVGIPEPTKSIQESVNHYIDELYKVSSGSDGDKSHFLSQGFCFDDSLEKLANLAKSPEDLIAVDSLSKDCVVLANRLQTDN
jgi:hypothetical protein